MKKNCYNTLIILKIFSCATYAKRTANHKTLQLVHVCNAIKLVASKRFMSRARKVLDFYVKKLGIIWTTLNTADIVSTTIASW